MHFAFNHYYGYVRQTYFQNILFFAEGLDGLSQAGMAIRPFLLVVPTSIAPGKTAIVAALPTFNFR
jgi:hypothetical protein